MKLSQGFEEAPIRLQLEVVFYHLLQSALFGHNLNLIICVGGDTGSEIQCCPSVLV